MTQNEANIVSAAKELFTQYGVKRTTMNDIAEKSGLSRQTVYNIFPNKDAIFRAIITAHTAETTATIRADVEQTEDLGAHIDSLFTHFTLHGYDTLVSTPHGEEIFAGIEEAAGDKLVEAKNAYRELIAEILEPYKAAIEASGMTKAVLGDLILNGVFSLKHGATDREHLVELIGGLKSMVLSVAKQAS